MAALDLELNTTLQDTTGLNQLQGRAILLVSVLREMEAILVEVEEEFATDVTGE